MEGREIWYISMILVFSVLQNKTSYLKRECGKLRGEHCWVFTVTNAVTGYKCKFYVQVCYIGP